MWHQTAQLINMTPDEAFRPCVQLTDDNLERQVLVDQRGYSCGCKLQTLEQVSISCVSHHSCKVRVHRSYSKVNSNATLLLLLYCCTA